MSSFCLDNSTQQPTQTSLCYFVNEINEISCGWSKEQVPKPLGFWTTCHSLSYWIQLALLAAYSKETLYDVYEKYEKLYEKVYDRYHEQVSIFIDVMLFKQL